MKFDANGNRVCPKCGQSIPGNLRQYNEHLVNQHDAAPTSGEKSRYRTRADGLRARRS